MPTTKEFRSKRNASIIKEAEGGIYYSELAKRYGITTERARQIAAQAGIRRKLFPEEIAKRDAFIIKKYRSEMKAYKIARRYGIQRHTVYRVLKQAGFRKTKAFLQERDSKIVAAYRGGESIRSLAALYNLTVIGIQYVLHKYGIFPQKEQQARNEIRNAEIVKLAGEGMSGVQLGKKFKMHSYTVNFILREYKRIRTSAH